jgi:hypothetical protein
MELEGSLLHSQAPYTCPYPEPDQSSPWPNFTSWTSILISSSLLRLGLPNGYFLSGYTTKTLYAILLLPYVLHAYPSQSSSFFQLNNMWWKLYA